MRPSRVMLWTAYFHQSIHWRCHMFQSIKKTSVALWHCGTSQKRCRATPFTTYYPVGGGKVIVLCLVKYVRNRKGCILSAYIIQQSTPPRHNNKQYCGSTRGFHTKKIHKNEGQSPIEPSYARCQKGKVIGHALRSDL